MLSLEDGKTYERAAVARRNLSRAAHERQAAAWATAKAHAVASLVEDASLTLVDATHQLGAPRLLEVSPWGFQVCVHVYSFCLLLFCARALALARPQAQKLGRLVAYRAAGLLGRPPESADAEKAFEAAKVVCQQLLRFPLSCCADVETREVSRLFVPRARLS